MHKLKKQHDLGRITLVALASFALSIIVGNEGVEAFYAVYIASGLLFTIFTYRLVKLVMGSAYWLALKLFAVVAAVFCWLIIVLAVAGPIFDPTINPRITVPNISWWIVVGSVLMYFFRFWHSKTSFDQSAQMIVTGLVSSMLTILVLFIAFLSYFGIESSARTLALVFATQATFLSNYIFTQTDYIPRVHAASVARFGKESSLTGKISLILIALPFILPVVVMLLIIG